MIEPKKLPRTLNAGRRTLRHTIQRLAANSRASSATIYRLLKIRKARAESKARDLISIVQATSALESQGVGALARRRMELVTTRQLLIGALPSHRTTKL